MNKYIISYDLRNPGQDYSALISKIEEYNHVKLCESTWIIKTVQSYSSLRNTLYSFMDRNDRLFVGALTGSAAWRNCIGSDYEIKRIFS